MNGKMQKECKQHSKKMLPKGLPWGTILENSSRFPWGTKIVPPCKREPFRTFFWKTAPFCLKGHYFSGHVALFLYIENVSENSALLKSGTKTGPLKDLFYGRSNGAPSEPFWYHLFF